MGDGPGVPPNVPQGKGRGKPPEKRWGGFGFNVLSESVKQKGQEMGGGPNCVKRDRGKSARQKEEVSSFPTD